MESLYGLIGFLAGLASGLLSVLVGGHLYSRVNVLRSPITGKEPKLENVALPYVMRTEADEAKIEREYQSEISEEEAAKAFRGNGYRDSIEGFGRNS